MFSQQKSYRRAGKTASASVLLALLVLLMVAPTSLVGVAGAQGDAQEAVGCGTTNLELTDIVAGVDLLGNEGPDSATATVALSAPLTAGEYLVRAISMDSHWDEPADEPREQFFVTVGASSTEAIADLPDNADFLGAEAGTATDRDLTQIAPEAFPGAELGIVSLSGGESAVTFTHIDLGTGTEANSISAAMISIACAATGLDISFDDTNVSPDGTASLTLNVANTGTIDQTGIRIRSRFPAGVRQVGDIVMTAGSSTAVGKIIRWEGDVAAGETAQIVIPVETGTDGLDLCANATDGTCVISAQLVGVDGGISSAADASIELATQTGPDLELKLNYSPAGANPESLTGRFTVVVTNNGDDPRSVAADDVVIRTDIASNLTVDSFSFGSTAGTLVSDALGQTWTVGTLVPGDTAALSFNVAMPLAGEHSVRAQVLSASGTDLDSTPGNLAARTSNTDLAIGEDDEAATLAVAKVPATTTTTTRAPRTTTTVAPVEVEEGFLLPTDIDLPEPVATESPELESSAEEQTEVAGATEAREAPIASVELGQQTSDATVPLALAIAATLIAMSAAVLFLDRRKKDQTVAAALATTKPVTNTTEQVTTTSSHDGAWSTTDNTFDV